MCEKGARRAWSNRRGRKRSVAAGFIGRFEGFGSAKSTMIGRLQNTAPSSSSMERKCSINRTNERLSATATMPAFGGKATEEEANRQAIIKQMNEGALQGLQR